MLSAVGHLELSAIREVLAALDEDELPLSHLYGIVHRASARHTPDAAIDHHDQAREEVDVLLDQLGWRIAADTPDRTRMYQVASALRRLGCRESLDFLLPYARAVERLAVHELDFVGDDRTRAGHAAAIARAVLFDTAISALRHLAREHQAAARFEPTALPATPRQA
jgi:hypothetical protein